MIKVEIKPLDEPATVLCVGGTRRFKAEVTPPVQGDFMWSVNNADKLGFVNDNRTAQTVSVTGLAASSAMNAEELEVEFTPSGASFTCTVTTNLTVVKVEFKTYPDTTPGPDKPHDLNMDTKWNESEHYQPFSKCVSHVWTDQPLDMAQYLDGCEVEDMRAIFHDELQWRVNGAGWQNSYELSLGDEPGLGVFARFNIEVALQGSSAVCDRLIITVVPDSTLQSFNDWYNEAVANIGWLGQLPALYSSIELTDEETPVNPEPEECNFWLIPTIYPKMYHPGAHFEMRSKATVGGHGHQAMYDEAGALIRSGISGGTADRVAPDHSAWGHWLADVAPFIWAAQLDGNPVSGLADLTAPIMHEGVYLQRYLEVRPIIANDKPELQPGTCPQ